MVDLDKMTWEDYMDLSEEEYRKILDKFGPERLCNRICKFKKYAEDRRGIVLNRFQYYEPDVRYFDDFDLMVLEECLALKILNSDLDLRLKLITLKDISLLSSITPKSKYDQYKGHALSNDRVNLFGDIPRSDPKKQKYVKIADSIFAQWEESLNDLDDNFHLLEYSFDDNKELNNFTIDELKKRGRDIGVFHTGKFRCYGYRSPSGNCYFAMENGCESEVEAQMIQIKTDEEGNDYIMAKIIIEKDIEQVPWGD